MVGRRGSHDGMPVIVDAAGARMGGAARFKAELDGYLARTGREDVPGHWCAAPVNAAWLVGREIATSAQARRVAINNVSFVAPGSARWTLVAQSARFPHRERTGPSSQPDATVPHIWRRAPGRTDGGSAGRRDCHTVHGHGRTCSPGSCRACAAGL